MSKIEIIVKLTAAGADGQRRCPNCHGAVRLTDIAVLAKAESDVDRALGHLSGAVRPALCRPLFGALPRGGALQAALLEGLAAAGKVLCAGDGEAVDVPRLVARLKAGTVWS